MDDYYSIKLKKKRLALLKKNKNFKFFQIDISSDKLQKRLKKYNFEIIIHLAASGSKNIPC